MRRWSLVLVLVSLGCTQKPRYQGDTVLGNFAFTATPANADACNLGPNSGQPFTFNGVFSYDSQRQILYLDTDGDPSDDHIGTLSGAHFAVHGSAARDVGCGTEVTIDEELEGNLFGALDGGCDAASSAADAGPPAPAADGGLLGFAIGCGTLTDTPRAAPADAGASCPTCALVYSLSAVRQQ